MAELISGYPYKQTETGNPRNRTHTMKTNRRNDFTRLGLGAAAILVACTLVAGVNAQEVLTPTMKATRLSFGPGLSPLNTTASPNSTAINSPAPVTSSSPANGTP